MLGLLGKVARFLEVCLARLRLCDVVTVEGDGTAPLTVRRRVPRRTAVGVNLRPRPPSSAVVPAHDPVAALAEHVDRAGTVTLFVGAGARDARPEVLQLAERVKARSGTPSAARSGSSTTSRTTSG
jgi:thiamine pyrophosphate-dependent acetolactate synthase large subunit-like protein